jgi:hypothetical protein
MVFSRKWWISPEFKAGPRFKPQALHYVGDLKRGPNAEIG